MNGAQYLYPANRTTLSSAAAKAVTVAVMVFRPLHHHPHPSTPQIDSYHRLPFLMAEAAHCTPPAVPLRCRLLVVKTL